MRHAVVAVGLAFASFAALAQTPRPVFEVASVKHSAPGQQQGVVMPAPGRFVAKNAPMRLIITWAYRRPDGTPYRDEQVIGGPAWLERDRFDIEGKTAGDVPFDQTELMTQRLLEDRCRLKTHRERRELPAYLLVVLKTGVKFTRSADQTPPVRSRTFDPNAPQPRGTLMLGHTGSGNLTLTGLAVPMSMLLNSLRSYADREVIDDTGLQGLFDLRIEFTPPRDAAGPDASDPILLVTALQEQLGLKLEPRKAQVEVLVIDGAQPPTED